MDQQVTELPGKPVLSFKKSDSDQLNTLGFEVRKLAAEEMGDMHFPYQCHFLHRHVSAAGRTQEEAIAALLHYVACLARDGALDPDRPERRGAPAIQHALEILQRELAWRLELRLDWYTDTVGARPGPVKPLKLDDLEGDAKAFLRQSEAIAALGTAISALARIKEP